ncbi:hypothetical protein BJX64DRAFT_291105 [Aspergillus heterothallicus]
MGTRTDGKPTRLRASCDACNESKVRCSQSKPTCARCDKQGITCIYGLSRRTHKNAPRIGDQIAATIPQSATSAATTVSNRDDEMLSSSSPASLLSLHYPALSDSTRATSFMSDTNFPSDHLGTLSDSFLLSSSGQQAQQQPHILGLASPALDLSVGPDPLSDDLLDSYNFLHQCHLSLPMDVDQLEQQPSKESRERGQKETQDGFSNLAVLGEDNTSTPCSCQSHLMKQLAAMPQAFQDHGAASFEVRLCEIQKAVKVVESCMQCTCTLQNYVAILMISTLVAYIIQGFEKALPRAGVIKDAADVNLDGNSGAGQHEHTTSRLSWGMLQIEPDDEDKLKRHLWLLHFRKFRRILVQFNESIGQLKGTESRVNLAQIAAYQFIHKWLEHELDNVTSQYQVQEGTGDGRLSKN